MIIDVRRFSHVIQTVKWEYTSLEITEENGIYHYASFGNNSQTKLSPTHSDTKYFRKKNQKNRKKDSNQKKLMKKKNTKKYGKDIQVKK